MTPLPGLSHPPHHVCHLSRAISGLKQGPHAWFERFRTTNLTLGYTESSHNYAQFTCQTPRDFTILLLYVNDMVISGDNANTILSLKQLLNTEF